MEFKRSFRINTTDWRCVYPKVHSWSLDGSGDCCSWDGIECDEVTGRVIALNLSKSCLLGTMSPNTTLFRLVHVESLNLAYNSFDFSPISYGFSNLSRLQCLNLSHSDFSGEIPHDISQLSRNDLLHPIPISELGYCGLNGDFPVSIFQLPNLEVLHIEGNSNLSGFLPKPHWGSPLKSINLYNTKFSGEIPSSIGNLSLLNELNASECHFSGSLPSSLGNLSHLTRLVLRENNLQGQIPVSFADLTQLSQLILSYNNLSGDTLEWVVNLTKLTDLEISDNRLSGGLPSSFENLKQLALLSLSHNDLRGDIPSTLWNLKDLEGLYLRSFNINGSFDLNDIFKLKNLRDLDLSFNNISFTKSFINATTSKLAALILDSCNLTEFPQFIGYLSELVRLDLPHNRIRGTIPRWMWNNSKESLWYIDLSHNLLTGFENNQTSLPLPKLEYLDVSSNLLETTLPVPPPSVMIYNISNNFLSGEVPTSICERRSLAVLDLSNNCLNGTLPPCLGGIGPLMLLNLARNKFDGMIPRVNRDDCALRMIDLRENRLRGIVPRSLGNCGMLEYLNLGDNQINDTFPFWLSELPYLKVIDLRSNKFHGPIEGHLSHLNFTNLHILDLSNNSFNDKLAYMNIHQWIDMSGFILDGSTMTYTLTLMNKGTKREYRKIPYMLVAIDLSSNKFEGSIPELIGDLKSLHMLNLSNNFLIGSIPPSLANLTVLESLDLSLNNLTGAIPHQLANLTFLEFFDVYHNRLSGRIPHGTQFDTFESSSFAMNQGLCGSPLPNKCTTGESAAPPPSSFKVDNEVESLFDLDWKIVLAGAGVGFLVGVVLGNLIIDQKSRWFLHYSKRMAKGWKR
ncbi:receptor-like protein 6 [Syzygium oleosum]|uniref:receptor-like protein 6 n=1 Tax=Syzygium oleosum TaxID=219896 RepID=UPI0024B91496|nr:receptor-like protein 6 [Syzygium oleosum]